MKKIFLHIPGLLKSDRVFFILFIIFSGLYFGEIMNKGPLNVHVWRQTDCLSLTAHYARGADFFSPEMHCQLGDENTSGKTAGEFPLLYYIIGKLWALFSESFLIYRLVYLLILFSGLFLFYRSLLILLRDTNWAVMLSMLLFTSPVYVFYGVSFLTDVPAISFVLIALFFLVKYHQKRLPWIFLVSMAFFALAGLLKTSSLIAFLFLFLVFLLELFPVKSLGQRKLFDHTVYEWSGFLAVFLLVFLWYVWAGHFNEQHGFKYTFNNIYPVWIMEKDQIRPLLEKVGSFPSRVFFSRPMLWAFLIAAVANLFLWKKIPLIAYLSSIIITAGSLMYFILWAPLMGVHDYYYVALLVLFPGIFLPFVWFIKERYASVFTSSRMKLIIGVFLAYNLLYSFHVVQLKTSSRTLLSRVLIYDADFIGLMKWSTEDVKKNLNRFREMKDYMREIGVKEDDKIISLPDQSFNSTLFLADRKGWTNYLNYSRGSEIEELIKAGAKYLFISRDDMLEKDFLQPYLSRQVGEYKGVKIFRLDLIPEVN